MRMSTHLAIQHVYHVAVYLAHVFHNSETFSRVLNLKDSGAISTLRPLVFLQPLDTIADEAESICYCFTD
jgi:hypothetical protein